MGQDSGNDDRWAPQSEPNGETLDADEDTIIRPVIGSGGVPVAPPVPPLPPQAAPVLSPPPTFSEPPHSVPVSAFPGAVPPRPPLPTPQATTPAAASRSGRMPVWGWIVIGIAGLAVVVGGGIGSVLLFGGGDTQTEQAASPSASASASADASPRPAVSVEPVSGTYGLGDTVPFTGMPEWQWTAPDGWGAGEADGTWRGYTNPAARCVLDFYNEPFDTTGDDATDSAALQAQLLAQLTSETTSMQEVDVKPVQVPIDDAGSAQFVRGSYDVTLPGDDEVYRLSLRTRVFSGSDVGLAVLYRCPVDAGRSMIAGSISAVSIVSAAD